MKGIEKDKNLSSETKIMTHFFLKIGEILAPEMGQTNGCHIRLLFTESFYSKIGRRQ